LKRSLNAREVDDLPEAAPPSMATMMKEESVMRVL
jgi:hypothetical protein